MGLINSLPLITVVLLRFLIRRLLRPLHTILLSCILRTALATWRLPTPPLQQDDMRPLLETAPHESPANIQLDMPPNWDQECESIFSEQEQHTLKIQAARKLKVKKITPPLCSLLHPCLMLLSSPPSLSLYQTPHRLSLCLRLNLCKHLCQI